jgi:hypothetical protein
VKPSNVRSGAIINKQGANRTSFELFLDRGELVFSVDVEGRGIVTSRAPIVANRWSHVGGFYDGRFVFLFIDGVQVGQISAPGIVRDRVEAIRIGSNRALKFFHGAIDRVFVSVSPDVSAQTFADLSCIRLPFEVEISPLASGEVQPETPFNYDIAITNPSVGACGAQFTFIDTFSSEEGISATASPSFAVLNPGETLDAVLTVMGTGDAEPGTREIPIFIFGDVNEEFRTVEFTLAAPTGCFVRTSRELMIRDLSVVEDPIRTTFADPAFPNAGVWTFANLMRQLAPSASTAPAMVEQVFESWLVDQSINTFTVPAREAMQPTVLDHWPRLPSGELDLERAPLRLLAIVNRIDIRDLSKGQAGEGRFVFGVLGGEEQFPLEFTMIFEYALPATTEADVLEWADRWHALSSLPFPSEQYNAALQAITDDFALRGVMPSRPNGSALNQLRSNEIALSGPWELREFTFGANNMLVPAIVQLTPDTSFMFGNTQLVADFINQNEAAVLAERHVVPESFQGVPFAGGSSFNDLLAWLPEGVNNPEARHKFSLNTCNGCHASEETNTSFLHVFPRFEGERSSLSSFLQGTVVFDPATGEPRTLNDLGRRNDDLERLVCGEADALLARTVKARTALPPDNFIRFGIGRVH